MAIFKSNFTKIAENTTKYYLELKNRYYNKFENEISLLATAGLLDAQSYTLISSPTITVEQLIELAKTALDDDELKISTWKRISYEKRHQQYREGNLSTAEYLVASDKEDVAKDVEHLFDFIFGLEILIFEIDVPKYSTSRKVESCIDSYRPIIKGITQTIEKYSVGHGRIADTTTGFMESPDFQTMRENLNIIRY